MRLRTRDASTGGVRKVAEPGGCGRAAEASPSGGMIGRRAANANAGAVVAVADEKIPDEGPPERRGGYTAMAERRWQEGAVGARRRAGAAQRLRVHALQAVLQIIAIAAAAAIARSQYAEVVIRWVVVSRSYGAG